MPSTTTSLETFKAAAHANLNMEVRSGIRTLNLARSLLHNMEPPEAVMHLNDPGRHFHLTLDEIHRLRKAGRVLQPRPQDGDDQPRTEDYWLVFANKCSAWVEECEALEQCIVDDLGGGLITNTFDVLPSFEHLAVVQHLIAFQLKSLKESIRYM